jgi:hypothetical protein
MNIVYRDGEFRVNGHLVARVGENEHPSEVGRRLLNESNRPGFTGFVWINEK